MNYKPLSSLAYLWDGSNFNLRICNHEFEKELKGNFIHWFCHKCNSTFIGVKEEIAIK